MRILQALAALAALAIISLPAVADDPKDTPDVDFRWNARTHDFGTFQEDLGRVTTTFVGTNIGTDTAAIGHISASCGCTTPTVDKQLVAPGDSVVLTVTYDAYNRPGPFDKHITFSAAPRYRARFTIKGSVIPSRRKVLIKYPAGAGDLYRLAETNIAFGNLRQDKTTSVIVNGINDCEVDVSPTVVSSPSWMTAIVEPATVQPGNRFALSITADGPNISELGLTVDTLVMSEASHPDVVLKIPVQIMLYEELPESTQEYIDHAAAPNVDVRELDFGSDIDPTSKKEIKRTFEIRNDGLEPLIIRRIYTIIPGFSIKTPTKPVAPGKSVKVEVALRPCDLRPGTKTINARISVISSTALNTIIDIAARGEVKQ